MDEKDIAFIESRPQITVVTTGPEVTITVSGISDDFQRVETNSVTFPVDCAREIGEALLGLSGKT